MDMTTTAATIHLWCESSPSAVVGLPSGPTGWAVYGSALVMSGKPRTSATSASSTLQRADTAVSAGISSSSPGPEDEEKL